MTKKDLTAKLKEWQLEPILGDKENLYQRVAKRLCVTRSEAQDENFPDEERSTDRNDNEEEVDGPTRKRENCVWNRGNWLSILANISGQVEYLGPLQDIWEVRNERMINGPKQVLVSMRKDQGYRETKMRLLHKLVGLEWLGLAFSGSSADRDWFKGYHIYKSQRDVLGRPLSCFIKKSGSSRVHIAYTDGTRSGVHYMTFEYKTTTLYKQETGVQFCEFRSMKDDNYDLIIDHVYHCSELADIIETYALLTARRLLVVYVVGDFGDQHTTKFSFRR